MEIKWGGRYMWNGVFLDEDNNPKNFAIFADSIEEAITHIDELPGTVVELSRGQDMSEISLDIPEDSPGLKAIEAAIKRKVN